MLLPMLLQAIVLASGGIVSVGLITIVILFLLSERGRQVGLGYAAGYTLSYTLIGVWVVMQGFRASEHGNDEPNQYLPILFICLGLLLLFLVVRNWRKGPQENEEPPRIFQFIDKFNMIKAFGLGLAIGVINFKNLAFFLSGISVVMVSSLFLLQKIVTVLLVALVFCSGVLVPVGIAYLFPQRAEEKLGWIKSTIDRYRYQIGVWLPLVFGVLFILRGING
ncbi:MAG: GAP family protein [Anaerolineales bacterium]|nr:GAP family protein [Anaerolineales bacterium]